MRCPSRAAAACHNIARLRPVVQIKGLEKVQWPGDEVVYHGDDSITSVLIANSCVNGSLR